MSTYSNAYTKVEKCDFHVQFQGKGFDIIGKDFRISTIWGIQNQTSFAGFENPKILKIKPIYIGSYKFDLTHFLNLRTEKWQLRIPGSNMHQSRECNPYFEKPCYSNFHHVIE